jgi:hypothetical protein
VCEVVLKVCELDPACQLVGANTLDVARVRLVGLLRKRDDGLDDMRWHARVDQDVGIQVGVLEHVVEEADEPGVAVTLHLARDPKRVSDVKTHVGIHAQLPGNGERNTPLGRVSRAEGTGRTPGKRSEGSGMDTWVIVLIVAGALVLLAVVVAALARSAARRRTEQQRAEAVEARQEARALDQQAAERERAAEEELARAERERAAARGHAQRAEEVDPDIDT